jgi:proteasome lid subunit RPN8/RPN11
VDEIGRPSELRIGRDMFEAVIAHLTAGLPNEAVALLAVRDEGEAARAVRFYPGTNIDRSATRYTMEPAEVLAAFRDIDANAWRFGAIVHSHPATPPTPSETDLRETYYPEALLVIVGLVGAVPVVRAWATEFGSDGTAVAAVEIPVVIDEARPDRTVAGDGDRS